MASWTSLAVLSAFAVSTLSLPGPEGAYNIPRVGTGRHSQYYVLHSDGTYKYGHDTGEGAFESARLNTAGDLDGEFGYTDTDGNNVNLQYKSGEGGFVARGDHLPVPHPDFNAAHAEARARAPFKDPLADSSTDASYNFRFSGEGQSRTEQSDAEGNVRGSYTYTDEEGNTRTFNYIAGRETGFVIEGNDFPLGPAESGLTPAGTKLSSSANRVTSSNRFTSGSRTVGTASDGSRTSGSSFSVSNTASTGIRRISGSSFSASNRASTGSRGTSGSSYSASNRASTGIMTSGSSFSASNKESTGSRKTSGSSFSALNRASTGSRGTSGSSFSALNRASTGSRGTSGSSFSALNRASTGSRGTSGSTYSASTGASTGSRETSGSSFSASNSAHTGSPHPSSRLPSRPFKTTTQSGSSASFSASAISPRGGANSDGSYSFSFKAGDHSRSESADANLNIEGQFSFVADDDVQRSVSYISGANRGFQATGEHLPIPPESHFGNRISLSTRAQTAYRAPTASRMQAVSSRPTPSHTQSVSHAPSVRGSTSSTTFASQRPSVTRSQQTFSSSSSTSSSSSSRVPFEEANTKSELRPDGSYAFAYETSSHSRSESGDSDNNVEGKFNFVADDGQKREIKYEAGSDTGFIAEGAHIPIGPKVPGAPSGQPTGRIVPVQEVPFVDPLADTDADASYNFSFESEQYSRSETADAEGNVQGTYTVVDDDGTRRTYRFRAGKGIGFETEEVSVSQGPPPLKPVTSSLSGSASSSFSSANTASSSSGFHGAASSSSNFQGSRSALSSFSDRGSSTSSSSFRGTGTSSSSTFRGTSTSSSSHGAASSTFRGGSGLKTTSYTAPSPGSR